MGVIGIIRCLLRLAVEGLILALIITFIPGLPPDASVTEPYKVTKSDVDVKFPFNNKLDGIEILYKDNVHGPESFADDGSAIYTTLQTGDVVKLVGKNVVPLTKFGKPCKGLHEEQICGRPLGIRFGNDGYLYISDAYYGVFKVDVKTGDKKQIVPNGLEIEGRKCKVPNSVAVSCKGDLYWTDSTTDFNLHDGLFAMLVDPTGRLIHYDAKTGKNKVLIDKLLLANGVMLSQNEDFVLVSDCGKNRILRYYLKGPKAGSNDVFVDGLPGSPDNIDTDGDSGFLITLILEGHSKKPNFAHVFSQFPNVRKFLVRSFALVELAFKAVDKIYPNDFCKKGVHMIGHFAPSTSLLAGRSAVVHVSKDGEVLDTLWSGNKNISKFSEAHIVKDQLYLGSPFNKFVGRIPLAKVGWQELKQEKNSLDLVKQKCSTLNGDKVHHQTKTETPSRSATTAEPTTTTTTKSTPKPQTTTQKPTTQTPTPTKPTHKPAAARSAQKTNPEPSVTTPMPPASNTKPVQTPNAKKSQPAVEKPKVVPTTQKPQEKVEPSSAKVKTNSDLPKAKHAKNEL